MKPNESSGLKRPDRRAAPTDETAICPTCRIEIEGLRARGPATTIIDPCGHDVSEITARELTGEQAPLRADGGFFTVRAYHNASTGEYIEINGGDEADARRRAADRLGCDEDDLNRGYPSSGAVEVLE